MRAVPVALAAHDAPRTLVSATYHVAALTHPEPLVAWSAVAVNVGRWRGFVQGKRDFVPDVIEALRSNEVPEQLLAAVRRVPLPRARVGCDGGAPGRDRAPADAEAALRLAYHEPLLERGLARRCAGAGSGGGRAGGTGRRAARRPGRRRRDSRAAWTALVDRAILGALAARLVRVDSAREAS